tara:strand:+ start:821 stop:1537 length:717 start_codon:yes stop_codon:yes gene_type:complete
MTQLSKLEIKIFADGADIQEMLKLSENSLIKGFTTNPSLMKSAGVKDYKNFAEEILSKIKNKPISFEVFSDELDEIERQAEEISKWGKNVYVKIPITNTKNQSTSEIIYRLSNKGISCNITAIFTLNQVKQVLEVLNKNTPNIISIFAGRIADTGIDPSEIMRQSVEIAKSNTNSEILWASTREVLNIFQAENLGCHIITVPHDLLKKLKNINKDLNKYSLETVSSFYKDAVKAGFKI